MSDTRDAYRVWEEDKMAAKLFDEPIKQYEDLPMLMQADLESEQAEDRVVEMYGFGAGPRVEEMGKDREVQSGCYKHTFLMVALVLGLILAVGISVFSR